MWPPWLNIIIIIQIVGTKRQVWADNKFKIAHIVKDVNILEPWEVHSNKYKNAKIGLVICEIGFELQDIWGVFFFMVLLKPWLNAKLI